MDTRLRLTKNSGREIIDKLRETLALAAVFMVPLWFDFFFPTDNVFELNKIVLFRALAWLLFVFTVWRFMIWPIRPALPAMVFFRKYWLIPLVFVLGFGLLTAASIDPLQSFYGTLDRQQGFLSQLTYFLWFLSLSAFLLDDADGRKRRRLLAAAALSGLAVSLYGILQMAGIDFRTWIEPAYLTRRISSSLGQPNFLASWLLLVLPVSAYLLLTARRAPARALWLFAGGLQLAGLFFTGSRGGFAGLALAFAVATIWRLYRSSYSWKRKLLIVAGLAAIALIGLIGLDAVSGGRVRELKDFDYGSLGARVNIYGAATQAWLARPWLGYGIENQEEALIPYYRADWAIHGDVGQTADRAHNIILDYLLTGGLAGLALFLLFAVFIIRVIRSGWRSDDGLSLAIAFALLAYFISLLFGFSFVAGEAYLWTFLAILVAQQAAASKVATALPGEPAVMTPRRAIAAVIVIAIAAILAINGIGRDIRLLSADHYFQKSREALARKDYFTALVLDSYLDEQNINPLYRDDYDQTWAAVLSQVYPEIKELAPQAVLRAKLARINASLSDRGYGNLLAKARASRLLGDYPAAASALERLVRQSPHWPIAWSEKARLDLAIGDSSAALSSLDQVEANLPAADDPRFDDEHRADVAFYRYLTHRERGDILSAAGRNEEAAAAYGLAYRNYPDDYTLLKKIADSYYKQGNLEEALSNLAHGRFRNPGDYVWPMSLAVLYDEKGERADAKRYLDEALRLAPDNQILLQMERQYQP